MLKRSKPMKRTGFKPKAKALAQVMRSPCLLVPLTKPVNYARIVGPAAPVEKDAAVRSETYRRLVAQLPCIFCGIEGFTQHAHGNTGKGAGIKADDRFAFPLCCDRPGHRGCHSLFDQGALFDKRVRRAIEPEWARRTALTILDAGNWPAGLPFPDLASS